VFQKGMDISVDLEYMGIGPEATILTSRVKAQCQTKSELILVLARLREWVKPVPKIVVVGGGVASETFGIGLASLAMGFWRAG